jgi:hypothetical protein
MIVHHADEQDKQVMDAQEAVVEESAHLSSGKRPDYKQACKHRPSGEANWCQKDEPKYFLRQEEMINYSSKLSKL